MPIPRNISWFVCGQADGKRSITPSLYSQGNRDLTRLACDCMLLASETPTLYSCTGFGVRFAWRCGIVYRDDEGAVLLESGNETWQADLLID